MKRRLEICRHCGCLKRKGEWLVCDESEDWLDIEMKSLDRQVGLIIPQDIIGKMEYGVDKNYDERNVPESCHMVAEHLVDELNRE